MTQAYYGLHEDHLSIKHKSTNNKTVICVSQTIFQWD
jgi:hypothetical protein